MPLIETISLFDFFSGLGIGIVGAITFRSVEDKLLGLDMWARECGLVVLGWTVLEKLWAE